ncbi:GNAT family N-acetyltransferase [Geodermatophilus sp. SYSU D00815]
MEDVRPQARPATRSDQRRLVHVLATAFAEDPVFTFLLPPSLWRREARLRQFFALEAARSARRGGTWVSADGSGAAVWFPPGQWQSTRSEDLLQGPRWLALLGSRAPAADRARKAMQARHEALAPHWYLLYLGAEPRRQSRGVGSSLLRAVLERCDHDGTPAYLEASCERNRQLYVRHGFADLDPLPLPDGGPVMYPMWRDPSSS